MRILKSHPLIGLVKTHKTCFTSKAFLLTDDRPEDDQEKDTKSQQSESQYESKPNTQSFLENQANIQSSSMSQDSKRLKRNRNEFNRLDSADC